MAHQGLTEPPDALDVIGGTDDVGLDDDGTSSSGSSACSTRAKIAWTWGSIS
jgi:hypothetical protein